MITPHQDERHQQVARATRRYRARYPERTTAAAKVNYANCANQNPIRYLLRGARKRAKAKGIPFDITWTDFPNPLPEFCPVLGLRLVYGVGNGKSRRLYDNAAAASLDRADNAKGYVKGNVIIVSLRANLLKGQATLDELQKIATFYSQLGECVS